MRSKISARSKFNVLVKIYNYKTILFGDSTNNVTKENKIKTWTSILTTAQSLLVVPLDKDWTYMRDVFWQNCRKRALGKIENFKKTGATEGKHCQLSLFDDIVMDIISSKDSKAVVGIEVEESMNFTNVSAASCSTMGTKSAPVVSGADKCKRQLNASSGKKRRKNTQESPLSLKKQKLTIEQLELLNTKLKLEIALLKQKISKRGGPVHRNSDGSPPAGVPKYNDGEDDLD